MSWKALGSSVEIIFFGNEEGATGAARDLGIGHIPEAPEGSKRLRSLFGRAQEIAKHDVLCYANCDIILTKDFLHAVNDAEAVGDRFLMVGKRWNLEQENVLETEEWRWKEAIKERARKEGDRLSGDWIDYFAFRRGMYAQNLPDLVIGRVHWDQWLL